LLFFRQEGVMGTSRGGRGPGARRGKGLIRSLDRKAVRSKKTHAAEAARGRLREPSVCRRCGAVFARRVWQPARKATGALLARAHWTTCPACEQADAATGFGRVIVRGPYAERHENALRRRIANVARRASSNQPERRISAVERRDGVLEVVTTSQKLAHRIVHELTKAFRGRARYAWSDDGTLLATWER
jgi:NMD protein affecting ribosome stability and mRNA decay